MDWGALTRRLSERWRIVGAYAVTSVLAQAVYRSSLLLTDQPAYHLTLLGFWTVVSCSCWWNIWRLLAHD